MKIDEHPQGQAAPALSGAVDPGVVGGVDDPEPSCEDSTRTRVCQHVLEAGPVSAADLGRALKLTPAAVRRHLDVLLEQGLVAARAGGARGQRSRGRPARLFVLTDAGHAAMATGYDDLATQALRYLATVAGPEAVRRFAAERLADSEVRYRRVVEAAGSDPLARAQALAQALSADGFAASTRALGVGATTIGTQLCQGHCPVQHVAREFPELCEAETDTFSRLLGVHVQRLATLAHGEHVCTTHVPTSGSTTSPAPSAPQSAGQSARQSARSDER